MDDLAPISEAINKIAEERSALKIKKIIDHLRMFLDDLENNVSPYAETIPCAVCGEEFAPVRKLTKRRGYCEKHIPKELEEPDDKEDEPEPVNVGPRVSMDPVAIARRSESQQNRRAIESLRKKPKVDCLQCGKPTLKKLYCSDKCRKIYEKQRTPPVLAKPKRGRPSKQMIEERSRIFSGTDEWSGKKPEPVASNAEEYKQMAERMLKRGITLPAYEATINKYAMDPDA